jgi:hypothetical protein
MRALYQTSTFTLAAGAECNFQAAQFLRVLSSTGALTIVSTSANDFGSGGASIPARVQVAGPVLLDGTRAAIGPVRFKNGTGVSITFTVATSNASIDDSRDTGETGLTGTVAISGNATVVGPGAEAAAPAGNPVRMAGSDGAALRTLHTDTAGNPIIVGAAAEAAAPAGNPVRMAGSDGAALRTLSTDAAGALTMGNSRKPTFSVSVLGAAPVAAGYILAAIEAGAFKAACIRRLRVHQVGNMTTAGRVVFSLLRTTAAAAGGVAATPARHEAADTAFSGIAKHTAPTITAGYVLWQGSLWVPAALGAFAPLEIDFDRLHAKGLVIAAGVTNGIALRCDTGGVGFANFDLTLELTEE